MRLGAASRGQCRLARPHAAGHRLVSVPQSHAQRVYSCIVAPQMRAAIELADKIKCKKVGADGFFSCRGVYLKRWSSLDSPEAVKQAADVLEDAGWIRDVSGKSGPAGGRPANRYQINPGLWVLTVRDWLAWKPKGGFVGFDGSPLLRKQGQICITTGATKTYKTY